MSLSSISIRNPVFAWMLMSFLIIFGGISFMRMGVSELPDVDFPVVSISVTLEGAAPEVMELDVVDPIEDSIMTIEGVKSVSSTSRKGSADISIEFDLDKNIDAALQEVQTKLAQAQRRLPNDIDPPVVRKSNPEDQPIMWLSASSDRLSTRELMTFVRDRLKDQFSRIPGVADVFLAGYVDPIVSVDADPKKLNQFALTPTDIASAIQNEHAEVPAGEFSESFREYSVRTMGEARTLDQLSSVIINQRGGSPNYNPFPLSQMAEIKKDLAEVRRLSRTNGKNSVGLGIRKQRGSNAVAVGDGVRAKVEELQPSLPEGIILQVNSDRTEFIKEAIGELEFTVLLSAILTALVCWLFLGSLSSTLNVVLAIPTSIIGTFIVLHFAGFTLNTFTLLGLSIAIGIVVDDAIMMLENISRHREMGKSKMEAALVGSREITFAAMAATVALIAIFIPVVFMEGVVGRFFFQFGVTMSVAVALSLVEALTLTPMRCSQFLATGERRTQFGRGVEYVFEKARRLYSRLIEICLRNRWKVIVASLIFFAATFSIIKFIPKEFLPAQDQSAFFIRLQTPVGSSLEFTDSKVKQVEKFLMERPEIERNFVAIGGFGGGEVNTAFIFVTMQKPAERGIDPESGKRLTQEEFIKLARQKLKDIPDLRVFLQDLSMRGFGSGRGFPVEFSLRGPEWNELGRLAQTMVERMNSSGYFVDADTSYKAAAPELQVVPDREAAASRGVSVAAIGQTVKALTTGLLVGKFPEGGKRFDIRLQVKNPDQSYREAIKSLYVRNNRGELIPLGQVVHLVEAESSPVITREDRERAVTVYANVAPGISQADALAAIPQLADEILPEKYRWVASGTSQAFAESFRSLLFALILGIIVSYMVLASQFNSFIHPFTVLMTLPFSVSGAFIALWIFGESLNLYSFIGLALLMGIVKKNGILLVDYTNQLRAKGMIATEALKEACPVRLRPILMTSFATIAGAIPPAIAIGPGAETRVPLAVAVIGGVFVSTILTLFVVPCVYSLFARARREERKVNQAQVANG